MHSCSLTPVVSKASSGVLELMPIHSINNTTEFCKILKESNWDVVGTGSKSDENNGRTYTPVGSFNLSHPTVIILGKFDLMSSNCRANNDVSFFFPFKETKDAGYRMNLWTFAPIKSTLNLVTTSIRTWIR